MAGFKQGTSLELTGSLWHAQKIPADNKSPKFVREKGGGNGCSKLKPSTSAAEMSDWLSPHMPTTCPFWAWVSSAVSCNRLMIFRFCVLEKHSRKSKRYWSNIALSRSNESLRKTWYVKGLLNVRSNWYFLCLKTHLFLPFILAGLIKTPSLNLFRPSRYNGTTFREH